MKPKQYKQLMEKLGTVLAPDERVDVTTLANVGSVSMARKVITGAAVAAVGIALGGTLVATVRPRPMFIVLTDRRFLFFDCLRTINRPGELLMELPRELVSSSEPKPAVLGLAMRTQWMVQGWDKGLKVVFPHVSKAEGRAILAVLPRA